MREEYKEFMPKETESILSIISGQTHENNVSKIKETKLALLDAFFQEQRNVEAVNGTMQEKIAKFKALTQDAKRENVSTYWEVFEVALDNLKQKEKTDQAIRANGRQAQTSSEAEYNEKVFERASFYNGVKK